MFKVTMTLDRMTLMGCPSLCMNNHLAKFKISRSKNSPVINETSFTTDGLTAMWKGMYPQFFK